MSEEVKSSVIVVLCPHCKTNQVGIVGEENKCINTKCEETFVPEDEVPVIVPE